MNIHHPSINMSLWGVTPHFLEDFTAAEGFTRPAHQEFQQAEFHAREADSLIGPEHLTLVGVDA